MTDPDDAGFAFTGTDARAFPMPSLGNAASRANREISRAFFRAGARATR